MLQRWPLKGLAGGVVGGGGAGGCRHYGGVITEVVNSCCLGMELIDVDSSLCDSKCDGKLVVNAGPRNWRSLLLHGDSSW